MRRAKRCAIGWLLALPFWIGCGGGGQDFGGFGRSLGGDLGSGYNNALGSRYGSENSRPTANLLRGAYPMIQTAFQLEKIPGNPFDYEKVNVLVTLRKPDGGTLDVPAFFDGGTTWRMRYTPLAPGNYAVAGIKLNQETVAASAEPKEWTVKGDPEPGFVRLDRGDTTRFVFDNGSRYFPIGHNQGWRSDKLPDIPDLFAKMGAAGENWSRVWMCHWGGANLDWTTSGKPVPPGEISLEVAKRWDTIVEAAAKYKIYFQLVVQHHGQYSSQQGYRFSGNVNANWEENPYNAKKGGFLQNPEDFFTNPQARALTKRKLYYMLARWGYSPNILAWELFNEVEHTDAAKGKLWDDIAMWHKEMTLFLRQYDGYRHLITTSSHPEIALESPIWETVDYLQTHTYPMDVITALAGGGENAAKRPKKPWFVGEFGAVGLSDPNGIVLHNGLWASLMRGPSGAAQYWTWDAIEQNNLYSHYKAATGFLAASGLINQGGLTSTSLPVETSQRAALRFGPGGGWGKATQHEFVVGASGAPAGIEMFPAYLQGTSKRALMPKPLTLQVNFPQAGAFVATVGQVARMGGKLVVSVDGKPTERAYPAGQADYRPKAGEETLRVEIPAGAHTITVENTGEDWLLIREFALSNYAPALTARARLGKEFAVAWVYHRANVDAESDENRTPASGRLTLTGLKPGRYTATWWDTRAGKPMGSAEVTVGKEKEGAVLTTPSILRDVALYVSKATAKTASTRKE
jgi:hypothetical protein